ncbi:hypothetical protein [Leptospira montravelensis]|nr:hypothetical protein [Leptospira montravelensis]
MFHSLFMYSPKSSVFVSLFSGLGLLGVVFFAPLKDSGIREADASNLRESDYVSSRQVRLGYETNVEESRSSEYKSNLKFLSTNPLSRSKKEGQTPSQWNPFANTGSKLEFDFSPQTTLVWDAKLSGEPSLSQPSLVGPVHPSAALIFRQIEANKRSLYDPRQSYEFQGSFNPSQFLKVQTAVYNVKTENPVTAYGAEGGKFSFFFGSDKIQLNVKYNYINPRPGTVPHGQFGFGSAQDNASLGLIFFLGSSKSYSLYVGNQIFNVFNDPLLQIKDQNGRSPETFSASFRGKHPGKLKTTFFLNFQNQFYKDGLLIGVPGGYMYGNGFNGKSFYEYVTSLGMELAF